MSRSHDNQRVKLTRRLLKETLVRLLETQKIESISVTALCREAGINRTTFYYHYGCPADVLRELEMETLDDICTCLNRNGPLDFESHACEICRYLSLHTQTARLLFCNDSLEDAFAEKLFSRACLILKEHGLSGEDEKIKAIEAFLLHGSLAIVRYWVLHGMPFSPEEMGRIIHEMSTQGWAHLYADDAAFSQF